MITRKQWFKYCDDIRHAKRVMRDVSINGQRVVRVDIHALVIYTEPCHRTKTQVIYTFEGSIKDHHKLKWLYHKTMVTASLERISYYYQKRLKNEYYSNTL